MVVSRKRAFFILCVIHALGVLSLLGWWVTRSTINHNKKTPSESQAIYVKDSDVLIALNETLHATQKELDQVYQDCNIPIKEQPPVKPILVPSDAPQFQIISVFAGKLQSLATAGKANRVAYCELHPNYHYNSRVEAPECDRKGGWIKIKALQQAMIESSTTTDMTTIDWFVWLDADLLFMDFAQSFEQIIEANAREDHLTHLITGRDQAGINSGVMLLRNTAWSRGFLSEVWECEEMIDANTWEQAAIRALMTEPRHAPHIVVASDIFPIDYTGYQQQYRIRLKSYFTVHLFGSCGLAARPGLYGDERKCDKLYLQWAQQADINAKMYTLEMLTDAFLLRIEHIRAVCI